MGFSLEKFVEENRKVDPEFDKEMSRMEVAFPIAMEIIRLRDKAGLTQAELAKRIGTSQSTIARLESGENLPSVKTLTKIATALEMPITITIQPLTKEIKN
jgi:transcriptional regulator with XRE-family HTH domain